MEIYKEFSFDSAHFLPNVPDGHKCKEMHGHTYKLKVFIRGELDPKLGWIMDFKDLKEALLPVIDQLDHKIIIISVSTPGTARMDCLRHAMRPGFFT